MENTKEIRKHYDNFYVAGIIYWDAPLVLESMRVGETVELKREEDNKFDPYAIAIYYHNTKIGYVPNENNQNLCTFLDTGHGSIFEVLINNIDVSARPERRIGITVYIKYVDDNV